MIINITVADRRASLEGAPSIVCANSGYSVKFAFDDEWGKDTGKIARFVWTAGGKRKKKDVPFNGDTVEIPKLIGTREVLVGVFEGDLQTTTPARIYCEPSILCYDGEPAEENGGSRPVSSNSVLLKDRETGTVYELYVLGGKMMMTAVG